jgi:hypothetical protein
MSVTLTVPLPYYLRQSGILSSDLPSMVVYRPGETLRFTLTVRNPSEFVLNYVLNGRIFKRGWLVWARDLLVDGHSIFAVHPRSQIQMQGSFSSDSTDIVLMIVLMHPHGSELSSVRTDLVSVAPALDLSVFKELSEGGQ